MRDLSRLLNPRSIAVVGGGAWCQAIIQQCENVGFDGEIWPIHPNAQEVAGRRAFPDVGSLPEAPDATFIGVNRFTTVEIVKALSEKGAGGAVCFASGFQEAQAEDERGADLQDALLNAAGEMPILGPNCYGFINYLDRALLWPDQHGGIPVESGVAIITQSSNIAINLTMQKRGLPIAYVVTAGNQAQIGSAEIGMALLRDPRVTALGLHIEGFNDIRAYETLAQEAQNLGKPIIALKVGKSEQARAATVSHTASLAGGDAGASALLARMGIARLDDIPSFLETLKLLHVTGPLPSGQIATISCSGGEASLAADSALGRSLTFPPLNNDQTKALSAALGPLVALANPLDYHTYIWRDVPAMTAAFAGMMDPALAMTMLIVDFPRPDRCDPKDWDCVIEAAKAAKQKTGGNLGLVATLPELLPEDVAIDLIDAGVVPIGGLNEALAACEAAVVRGDAKSLPIQLPSPSVEAGVLTEAASKSLLKAFGLHTPKSRRVRSEQELHGAIDSFGLPCVIKAEGLAHKSDVGGVYLAKTGLDDAVAAAKKMPCDTWLMEELIEGALAELLIGVVKDPAHGFVLTLAAGGVLTELLEDSVSMLVPATEGEIEAALGKLRIFKMISGFRGARAASQTAVVEAIKSVQDYVVAHAEGLEEVEINPLICTAEHAVAVDALIRRKD